MSPERGSPACPATSPPPDMAMLATAEAGGAKRRSVCCPAPQDTSLRPSGELGAADAPVLTWAVEAAGCRYSLGLTAAVAAMLSLDL